MIITFSVKLKPMLYGGNGAKHGEPVHPGLDVRGGTELIGQHLGHPRDLILGRNYQGNHRGPVPGKIEKSLTLIYSYI